MTPLFKTGLPRQRRVVRPVPESLGGMSLMAWLLDLDFVPAVFRGKKFVGYERDCPQGREGHRAIRAKYRRIGRDRRRLKAVKRRVLQAYTAPFPINVLLLLPDVFVPPCRAWKEWHAADQFLLKLRHSQPPAPDDGSVVFVAGGDGFCRALRADDPEIRHILERHEEAPA